MLTTQYYFIKLFLDCKDAKGDEMAERTIVSFRIDNEHLELLEALADIDNSNLAYEIRTAVEYYISSRVSEKTEISAKIAEIKKKRELRLHKLLNHRP